jgi:predicted  nucleic acid-binding Zn-ribbon protein
MRKEDKFSSTEVGALIESLRSEIRPVLEAIPGIQNKLDSIFEQVGKNTEKLGVLETVIKSHTEKIDLNQKLIERVLEELKSKVDRKDFEILEKKVISLLP